MSGILRMSLFYKKLNTAVKICDIKTVSALSKMRSAGLMRNFEWRYDYV